MKTLCSYMNGGFSNLVSTDPLGGPGEASVAISVVDYALSDWYGEEARHSL